MLHLIYIVNFVGGPDCVEVFGKNFISPFANFVFFACLEKILAEII